MTNKEKNALFKAAMIKKITTMLNMAEEVANRSNQDMSAVYQNGKTELFTDMLFRGKGNGMN